MISDPPFLPALSSKLILLRRVSRQCVRALDYALDNSPIHENKLSKDGKGLVEDFLDIIRTAKQIVTEKNDDELLQNFM